MAVYNIKNKILNATKWSTISEIVAKIITPLTNMVLARILAPEAFGVIATVTMIISFADMFTDSGFQKFLVQHEFENDEEKYNSTNIAFWSNFVLSIFLYIIIFIFRSQLAALVGNPGLGNVLAVASIQLILTAFSSIQMAIYRRDFEFRTLFIVRLIGLCIPFVITIPLALLGLDYWSLIIGTLVVQLSNAIILTAKSKWKPKLYYSFSTFKEMFSFSVWSLIEAISIWLTTWIDAFIIGSFLNSYYMGLYKTSIAMVNTLLSLITSATTPVLFSALSRLQDDESQFFKTFLKFQRLVSALVFPLGIGVYLYSDLATEILLGSKWTEAAGVIAMWGITSPVVIVFSHYCSEVYRSKGMPKLSFYSQVLHLVFLVPTCIISAQYGFWALVYARSLIRFQGIIVHMIFIKYSIKLPILKIFKNVIPPAIATFTMALLCIVLKMVSTSILFDFISIAIAAIFYFCILFLFPKMRKELLGLVRK